jgi:hypothetical protein
LRQRRAVRRAAMNATTTEERLAEVRRHLEELTDRLANARNEVGGAWLDERDYLAATLEELAQTASDLAARLRRDE